MNIYCPGVPDVFVSPDLIKKLLSGKDLIGVIVILKIASISWEKSLIRPK